MLIIVKRGENLLHQTQFCHIWHFLFTFHLFILHLAAAWFDKMGKRRNEYPVITAHTLITWCISKIIVGAPKYENRLYKCMSTKLYMPPQNRIIHEHFHLVLAPEDKVGIWGAHIISKWLAFIWLMETD